MLRGEVIRLFEMTTKINLPAKGEIISTFKTTAKMHVYVIIRCTLRCTFHQMSIKMHFPSDVH